MSSPKLVDIKEKHKKYAVSQTRSFMSREMGTKWEHEISVRASNDERFVVIFSDAVPQQASLTIRLTGRGARAEIVCLCLGASALHARIRILLSHEAPDTFGRVIFRAVLRDHSRADLTGMIRIAKGADGSDSYLSAKALLLSKHSIARLDPQLEILANAVKASHGATAGRPREEEMFYLQNRGLNERDAEKILVMGFLGDVMGCLSDEMRNVIMVHR